MAEARHMANQQRDVLACKVTCPFLGSALSVLPCLWHCPALNVTTSDDMIVYLQIAGSNKPEVCCCNSSKQGLRQQVDHRYQLGFTTN